MDNPFHYGQVVTGAYFTNRASELAELERDVRSGQDVVVISPRRYGKTSLIFRAMEQLRQEHVLTAYVDLFRAQTKERLAGQLADAIYSGLVAPFDRVRHRLADAFQSLPLRPKLTIGQDGSPSFEFSAGASEFDVNHTIESLLEMPSRIATERKRRVLLALDEFQEVVTIDPDLPALMRSIFQFQTDVAHVYLGSRQHLMLRVFSDRNEPFYRSARPVTLRPIRSEEFAAFIRAGCAKTEQPIADEAIDRILAVTGAHPHDTQELCNFAWNIAQAERATITPALVERALARVVEAENAHYTTLWEALAPQQRLVLLALTQGGEEVYSERYRRRHGLGAASSVQRSLKRLIELDLVESTLRGTYRIPDVFLRAWLIATIDCSDRTPPTA